MSKSPIVSLKNQGSISPTFYTKLSHAPIPKAQKDSQLDCIFGTFGICACKNVGEIDT
jgi:hypothetical protein